MGLTYPSAIGVLNTYISLISCIAVTCQQNDLENCQQIARRLHFDIEVRRLAILEHILKLLYEGVSTGVSCIDFVFHCVRHCCMIDLPLRIGLPFYVRSRRVIYSGRGNRCIASRSTYQSASSTVGQFALFCLSRHMHAVFFHWLKQMGDADPLHLSRRVRSITANKFADHG